MGLPSGVSLYGASKAARSASPVTSPSSWSGRASRELRRTGLDDHRADDHRKPPWPTARSGNRPTSRRRCGTSRPRRRRGSPPGARRQRWRRHPLNNASFLEPTRSDHGQGSLSRPVERDERRRRGRVQPVVHRRASQEVLALPGVRSVRRFRLAPAQVMPDEDQRATWPLRGGHRRLGRVRGRVPRRFGDGRITIRPDLSSSTRWSRRCCSRSCPERRKPGQPRRVLSMTATIRTGRSPRFRQAWRVPRCTTQSPGWSTTRRCRARG